MLGDAIKLTSSSGGAGALAVAAASGYATPAQAGLVVGQPFIYTIYTGSDTAKVFRETGLARMSDATTMQRVRIFKTWSGSGAMNAAPGQSPTDFAGAAVTVICTPNDATLESMLATVDGQSSGINRIVSPANRNLATTTLALTALRCYYLPFLLRVAAPVNSLQFNVSTAGAAGTVARAGIYAANELGYMGALLATTPDQDVSTTGLKPGTLGTPLLLPPGWYFAALVSSGTPTVTAFASAFANLMGGHPFGAVSGGLGQIEYRYETLASAVLPATASATTTLSQIASGNVPAVYMGLA